MNTYNKDMPTLQDLMPDAVQSAQNILGYKLVYDSPAGKLSGYIVETEAYTQEDPASHTFRGQTFRNAPMFGPAGTVYVYFTYGMHFCCNIASGNAGHGEGVLIRALQPLEGVDIMRSRRAPIAAEEQLTNGPAKFTQAFGIDRTLSGSTIGQGPLSLEVGFAPERIVQTTRVGIKVAQDVPWRFYIADNPFVSKK